MPRNIAEFRVIGNVGNKRERDKVTYVSVGATYNRRDGEEWKSETLWNRGRYIERTQIYAKRRQVCLGVRNHPFVVHPGWRQGFPP